MTGAGRYWSMPGVSQSMAKRPPADLPIDEVAPWNGEWIDAMSLKTQALLDLACNAVVDAGIFDTLTEVLRADYGEVSEEVALEVFNARSLDVLALLCGRYLDRNPPPPLSEPQPFVASAAHMVVVLRAYHAAGLKLTGRASRGEVDMNDVMHLAWLSSQIGALSEEFRANIHGFDKHHETANRIRAGGAKGAAARRERAEEWRVPLVEYAIKQRAMNRLLGQKAIAKRAVEELQEAGVPVPDDLDQVVAAIRAAEKAGTLPRSSKNPGVG